MQNQERKINNIFLYIILSIFSVIVLTLLIFGMMYVSNVNKFNTLKQNCNAQYSQVQAVMQRRYDLIPNMTAAVKGDMKQERAIFSELAKARSDYASASSANSKLKADDKINKQTNLLISAINERYPKLASDNRVHDLMIELEGSENRINQERRHYIQDVQNYNTVIGRFPSNFFANMSGYTPIEYYKADASAQTAPKVDLN